MADDRHFDDEIHEARVRLFEMGGMTLVTDSARGRMAGDYPAAERRAALYNELADLHQKTGKMPIAFLPRLMDALHG